MEELLETEEIPIDPPDSGTWQIVCVEALLLLLSSFGPITFSYYLYPPTFLSYLELPTRHSPESSEGVSVEDCSDQIGL